MAFSNVVNYTFTNTFNNYLSKWVEQNIKINEGISFAQNLTQLPFFKDDHVVVLSEGYFFNNLDKNMTRPPVPEPKDLPEVDLTHNEDDTIILSEYFFNTLAFEMFN